MALALIMGLCLFLFACRKDISLMVNGRDAASGTVLENAKIWRLQHLKGKNSVLKPLWDDSWKVISTRKQEFLIVPAPEHYIADENYRIRRIYVFSVVNDDIKDGQIVEFFGANFDVEKNLDRLIKNFEETEVINFSGAINRYDVNYVFLNNRTFENGKLSKKILGYP